MPTKSKFILKKKTGSFLLELLIAISLLAIPMSMLFKKEKSDFQLIIEKKNEISEFFQRSFSNAIFNQKIYEIRFFFSDDFYLKKISASPFEKNEKNLLLPSFDVDMKNEIKIKKLIINDKNELDSSRTKEAWVLVYPEGYCQEVEIHLETTKNKIYNAYKINPFNCKLIDII